MSKSLLPRPSERAPFVFPIGAAFHIHSLVLHATARIHHVENFTGPLSIKTVMQGEAFWRTSAGVFGLGPDEFLICNAGEIYSIAIDSLTPVTTCCVFFATGFVERIALDATTPVDAALDDPERDAPALEFLSRLHSGPLTWRVQSLAERCSAESQPSSFEEDFLEIAHGMLYLYREIQERIARIPAARLSTRKELFRRIERAREYMRYAGRNVSLTESARVAGLSPYHFHRAFSAAHQTTPHAYLTRLRLEIAKERIANGALISDAADGAGFSNPPSFTRLFRMHYGMTPTQFRKIG